MFNSNTKKVLLCGHRSFAARGLLDVLEASGHEVTLFSRGKEGRAGLTVLGPVEELHTNPYLDINYDTVVNYIVLKYTSIEKNITYIKSLLEMCREKSVKHLIHVSSMSVYIDTLRIITEDAPIKTDPSLSGPYASLKIATDLYLITHTTTIDIKLTLIRPSFILGEGLKDPIGSFGLHLPWNQILILGRPSRQRPVISRNIMNKSIERIVSSPPIKNREILLMVDRNSPSCRDYLQGCCEILGLGTCTVSYLEPFWIPVYLGREIAKSISLKSMFRIFRSIKSRCSIQKYDPLITEQRLGLSLKTDWKNELYSCVKI